MEEKHIFTYKKLVVPSAMRSIYWKYFGFPASDNGEIFTKVKIVCILCKSQIAYNKNTSNLRMHLHNKHPVELAELESTPSNNKRINSKSLIKKSPSGNYICSPNASVHLEPSLQLLSTDNNNHIQFTEPDVRIILKTERENIDNGNSSSGINIPAANTSEVTNLFQEKTLSDNIIEFLIHDLEYPDVMEGRGFQMLIASFNSPFIFPSKAKLQEDILPKMYENCKELVQSVTASIQGSLSLTMEEWIHSNGEVYITVSVYFIHENNLDSRVLVTLHGSKGLSVAQWTHFLDLFLIEFDINVERVTAVVIATTQDHLIQALHNKGFNLIPCLMHSLQLCASCCFNHPEIEAILNKCRATIGLISNYSAAKDALHLQEQMFEVEEGTLQLDTPSVWMSTYIMLEQLQERRHFISSVLENIDGLERDMFLLDEHQWSLISDLLMVLRPLKVTILTISEEKSPLISILKPLNLRLNQSHLKIQEDDSQISRALKEELSQILNKRYESKIVNDIITITTLLDPRFKLHWNEQDRDLQHNSLKSVLVNFLKEEHSSSSQDSNNESTTSNEQTSGSSRKKIKLSGMEFFFGDLCSPQSSLADEEKANLELIQYESEPNAALEECPLECWQRLEPKCPSLARLASRYLCIPPCVIPPARISHENQIAFNIKRAKLPSGLVDKMIFLHHNYQILV